MEKCNEKTAPLKIAMLGHKTIPSRLGGVEIVVEEEAVRMASLGHAVTLYNRTSHSPKRELSDQVKVKEYKGVRMKYVPTIPKRGFAAMSSSIFATIAAALGHYDVVHFHAEGPCAMLWLPKLFGKRCIATIHGLDHQRSKWGSLASSYIMIGEKMAVKYADEIIVLSENVQNYFRETYGRETKFIPNGVNPPVRREPNSIRQQYGLEKDSYVLFLGRLVPEKGLSYLLEAFSQVKTDKKLVIAGDSSDTNAFVQKLKKQSSGDGRILYTGLVQDELLDELYSNAYVYVLPSDLEGMPLSLLEAMSYGNCCLVSDIEECTEVVEDKALTFKASNVNDLRRSLQMLCEDEKLVQKYKESAADFICSKYDWDETVKQTLALYTPTEGKKSRT